MWEDEANAKRAAYTQLLRRTFPAEAIFDLAAAEALRPDGRFETAMLRGEEFQVLHPGYTSDGGHLNAKGKLVVARKAIRFLASMLRGKRC